MPFIRNTWYVIAWSHEVPAGELFARRVAGESIVLYRRTDGSLVALENKCPHRHAPLALGRLEGDCGRARTSGQAAQWRTHPPRSEECRPLAAASQSRHTGRRSRPMVDLRLHLAWHIAAGFRRATFQRRERTAAALP